MVNRFQAQEVTIFDLDGTLIKVNSYKVFIFLWSIWLIVKIKFSVLQELSLLIFRRVNRQGVGRVYLKKIILELYHNNRDSKFEGLLVGVLYIFRRKKLIAKIQEHLISSEVIMITAAYCFYSHLLAQKLNIDKVICTSLEDIMKGKECIGEEKVNRLKEAYGIDKVKYLYTDHSDDLPLIKKAKISFIVKPSKKSRLKICQELNAEKANIHFI